MTMLTDAQRALLEKVDKWSMSDPLVMAVTAALATIDALRSLVDESCTEIVGLRAQADRDRDTIGVLMHGRDAHLKEIDAQREEIERLKETDAESLGVWEREQKRIAALEAENAALRETPSLLRHVHDLGVYGGPLSREFRAGLQDVAAWLDALRQGGEVMVDREADARLAAACPATTGTAEDWRRYAPELVAAEKARIIARIKEEAGKVAANTAVDEPVRVRLATSIFDLADLLESEGKP